MKQKDEPGKGSNILFAICGVIIVLGIMYFFGGSDEQVKMEEVWECVDWETIKEKWCDIGEDDRIDFPEGYSLEYTPALKCSEVEDGANVTGVFTKEFKGNCIKEQLVRMVTE